MLNEKQQLVINSLANLSLRDILILIMRFNLELTYQQIGDILGLTNERLRQLEKLALKKICKKS